MRNRKKPGGTAGRYKLHLDFPPTLWLCNYHEGGEGRSFPLYEEKELAGLTPAERDELKEQIRQEKEAREAERAKKSKRSAARLMASPVAGKGNPYLAGKGLEPLGDLHELRDGTLVMPLLDAGGNLASAQRIMPDGGKRFLRGGHQAGCFFPIPARDGGKDGPLLIDGGKADFADHWARGDRLRIKQAIDAALAGDSLPLPDKLPSGFSLRKGGKQPGLWHVEPKDDEAPVETWVGGPLHVLGATRDDDGQAWGLLLEWLDPDGHEHRWAMPRAVLASKDNSAVLARLADGGWRFAPGQRARNLLCRYLGEYQTSRRVRCVPRTGWHGQDFVLPDEVLYAQKATGRAGHAGQAAPDKDFQLSSMDAGLQDVLDGERLVFQRCSTGNPFCAAGTLEGWRDTVGAWAASNSRLTLAICAAFAGPLLDMCGMEIGGFNFSGQSSSGKTTALVVTASVWGRGASSPRPDLRTAFLYPPDEQNASYCEAF